MLVLFAVVVVVVVGLYLCLRNDRAFNHAGEKLPGPPSYPLVGNAFQVGTNTVDFMNMLRRFNSEFYGSAGRLWIGKRLFVVITTPEDTEVVLGSNKLLDKAETYTLLHPWLGTGLLTSTGAKWRKHRKILTPTFHFKILEEFVEVFQNNSQLLVEALRERVGGPAFDIHKYITLNALDNICETAMGVKINALQDSESEYVRAIRDQSHIVMERSFKLWMYPDVLFNFSSLKSRHVESLKIMHDVTNGVIKSRRAEMTAARTANGSAVMTSEDGVKRRLAFLDLLIESTLNGSGLTDEDIREEVDTFMFEGHDTTASAISFTFWLLSWNQDIQDKVVQELEEVWSDPSTPLQFRALTDLKYMERVIKEALRLYPSVPFFARYALEDTILKGGLVAPKGANLIVLPFFTHRDPVIFPDPEKFDPDRFLPENVQGRHPYAYTPFSAGPRNCIGQKFAMMEMKISLAGILRNYRLLPGTAEPDVTLSPELILTSKYGIKVILETRQSQKHCVEHSCT